MLVAEGSVTVDCTHDFYLLIDVMRTLSDHCIISGLIDHASLSSDSRNCIEVLLRHYMAQVELGNLFLALV